jgi:hypothetical protein
MDASEAREHLEMVEKIIAASSTKLEAGGEFFVVWGLAGAAVDVIDSLVWSRRVSPQFMWLGLAVLGLAMAFSIVRGRAYRKIVGRMSLLQREYFNVLWLAMSIAFLANALGFNLFGFVGIMAIWSIFEVIVLLYIGMHGNRRALIGGLVLIISVALANFVPQYSGYILAAGVLVGYAGFGAADLLARE